MFTLKTIENKTIKLTKAEVRIQKNQKCENGYYVDLELSGVLPGCRKPEVLTQSFDYNGNISYTTLFGYRKHHSVNPEEIRKLIYSVPVISKSYYGQVEVTPELVLFARKQVEEMCDCPAVKGC